MPAARTRGERPSRLLVMLLISAVAGLVTAGVLLPLVGGLGLAARAGASSFDSLPTNLKEPPLAQLTRIVDDKGRTFATFYYQDRVQVSLTQVPQLMQQAIVAIEDVRFYEHHGVDFRGTLRALIHNGSSGAVSQGGSTLTQQYVKNVLIDSATTPAEVADARADTVSRKAQEARYALALEQTLTKDQILERYLNIAYFGDGAYGVGTAAYHYFGVTVEQLTLPEEAMLAGLVQSPDAYDPVLHPMAAKDRRDVVLGQMLKYGFIQQADYQSAVASKIVLHLRKQGNGCEASSYPWFCDYVQHIVEQTPGLGRSALLRGGLTIRTTLDVADQKAADAAIQKYVPGRNSANVAAAEVLVEPGTGKVKAIAVSAPYGTDPKKGETTIDYAVDTAQGGGKSRWIAGSTFKLFVLAAALKEGIPLHTSIVSPPTINETGYRSCSGPISTVFSPHNDEGRPASYDLVTGTWDSVNTFYAQLEQRTGLCEPTQLAADMGVTQANGQPVNDSYPSFVLGASTYGYSPLDIAGAYATIAAHGTYCPPVAVESVTTAAGVNVPMPATSCHQALDPDIADTISSILQGVLTQTGATAYGLALPGRPAAAKTGTADNYTASNFAGFVPQLAGFVWVGHPDSPNQPLSFANLGGTQYGKSVFGATIAGPIWHQTFTDALAGVPVEPLPKPVASVVNGTSVAIPDLGGETLPAAEATLTGLGLHPVVGGAVDSLFPAGTVGSTTPGFTAYIGQVVVVHPSNGVPPPAAPQTTAPVTPATKPPAPAPPGGAKPPPKPKPTHQPPPHH